MIFIYRVNYTHKPKFLNDVQISTSADKIHKTITFLPLGQDVNTIYVQIINKIPYNWSELFVETQLHEGTKTGTIKTIKFDVLSLNPGFPYTYRLKIYLLD